MTLYDEIRFAVGKAFNSSYDAFCASLRDSSLSPKLATVIIEDMERGLKLLHGAAIEALEEAFDEDDDDVVTN